MLIAYLGPFIVLWLNRSSIQAGTRTKMSRDFNLVKVLASVDRESLQVFSDEPTETNNGMSGRKGAREQVILDLKSIKRESNMAMSNNATSASPQQSARRVRYVLKPRVKRRKSRIGTFQLLSLEQASQSRTTVPARKPSSFRSSSPSERVSLATDLFWAEHPTTRIPQIDEPRDAT